MNTSIGLSPGNETIKRALKLNKKRKKNAEKSRLKETKRKRVEIKKKRSSRISVNEVKEGTTYQSGIGIECIICYAINRQGYNLNFDRKPTQCKHCTRFVFSCRSEIRNGHHDET